MNFRFRFIDEKKFLNIRKRDRIININLNSGFDPKLFRLYNVDKKGREGGGSSYQAITDIDI